MLILTAHGTIPDAVAATQRGVFGFLTKPFDSQELLHKVADGAQALRRRRRAQRRRAGRMARGHHHAQPGDGGPAAAGQARRGIGCQRADLRRVGHRQGAPGAGDPPREPAPRPAVRRRQLRRHSRRSCWSRSSSATRAGAFTGAVQAHKGLFQAADGGTLLLDEIGDMPLPLQVKLLRVLQEGEVRPVGSTQPIPVDVRVISATHRDLDAAKGVRAVPRGPLLPAQRRVAQAAGARRAARGHPAARARTSCAGWPSATASRRPALPPDAMALLVAAPWPGNVRQLLNLLEQAMALATTTVIPATLVQSALKEDAAALIPFEEARKSFERDYLVRLLKITGGNVTQAAQLAKRNRTEFYKLLQRHRLEPAMFKEAKTLTRRSRNARRAVG